MIEREILYSYHRKDYSQVQCLCKVRKEMLNEQAMLHQKELLPDIIAFNDAFRDALKVMYDKAISLYRQVSAIQPNIDLEAKCYLCYDYPKWHPYQADHREELWEDWCIKNPGGMIRFRGFSLFYVYLGCTCKHY